MSPASSRAYAWAYERAFYLPWQHLLHGRDVAGRLEELEEAQWRPPEVIERAQVAALRAMLAYAGEHVPYYRELFAKERFDPRGVTSRRALAALPLLTREIIRERHDDLVDPAHRATNVHKGTSGTTAMPLRFEYSAESETWRQAVRLRGYGWAGYRMGMPTIHYWGAGDGPGGPPTKVRLDRALRREVYVDCGHQDDASMHAMVDLVRRVQPHAIIAYTQPLALFARWVHERGLRDWEDIAVLCGAEAVLPSDRAAIARVFGPRVFETYGARETMLIGSECELRDGLHLSEENLVVEIAQDGAPVPDGTSGDVVVTDLHNLGMPLVRYRTGDVARMAVGPCRCGRGLRRLAGVDGRRADTLHDAEGRPIPGILFLALLVHEPDLANQFRVVQRAGGDVVVEIVRGPKWSDAAYGRIVARMREHLHGLPLRTEFVDAIPPGPNGKHRPIVVEPRQISPA